MKRYINTRQLYFLIFLAALFFLARMRSGHSDSRQESSIQSTLYDPVRSLPLKWTSIARCQMECYHLDQDALIPIIKYGSLHKKDHSIFFQGRGPDAETYLLQAKTNTDSLIVLSISIRGKNCPCQSDSKAL